MSAAAAAAAAAVALSQRRSNSAAPASSHHPNPFFTAAPARQGHVQQLGRYEAQKTRDWDAFLGYLRTHNPPVALTRFSGDHVLGFLEHVNQLGGTKVHSDTCPLVGILHSRETCACPTRQACGSLDGVVGRLRAAFVEHGGPPAMNPFGSPAVRLYLKEVRDSQDRARGRV